MRILKYFVFLASAIAANGCVTSSEATRQVTPAGAQEKPKTKLLEAGAAALQTDAPPDQLDLYLVGLHPMKEHPQRQMEAHHFCKQVNEDFAQCALFDGNTKDANLNGIEYIISEKLFNTLSVVEKKYWHPHNYEILSGQLVAPRVPHIVEKELMKGKMNSYGKTWHVWNTGHYGLDDAAELPLGKPSLAWSFNRDGEALPGLIDAMQNRLNIKIEGIREKRQELVPLAHPQSGVNEMMDKYKKATKAIPGVRDAGRGRKK